MIRGLNVESKVKEHLALSRAECIGCVDGGEEGFRGTRSELNRNFLKDLRREKREKNFLHSDGEKDAMSLSLATTTASSPSRTTTTTTPTTTKSIDHIRSSSQSLQLYNDFLTDESIQAAAQLSFEPDLLASGQSLFTASFISASNILAHRSSLSHHHHLHSALCFRCQQRPLLRLAGPRHHRRTRRRTSPSSRPRPSIAHAPLHRNTSLLTHPPSHLLSFVLAFARAFKSPLARSGSSSSSTARIPRPRLTKTRTRL